MPTLPEDLVAYVSHLQVQRRLATRTLALYTQSVQPQQGLGVERQRARRQSALHLEVADIRHQGLGQRGHGHTVDLAWRGQANGSSRTSPALAISPMRTNKSVAMSAL